MKDWRKFISEGNESDELALLFESHLPLSLEEFEVLKQWGELEGSPAILGVGTMGTAFRFGDKVLKVTNDFAEAKAAKLLVGRFHPNVYRIHKVARRWDPKTEQPSPNMKDKPFVIVYDYVPDLPTKEQQEVISAIFRNRAETWYNWSPSFMNALYRLSSWLQDSETIELVRNPKELFNKAPLSNQETECLELAISMNYGFPRNVNSDTIEKYFLEPEFIYMNQIASGLTFMKKNGIRFLDLKTTNVLRDGNELVIIDIGKSAISAPNVEILSVRQEMGS